MFRVPLVLALSLAGCGSAAAPEAAAPSLGRSGSTSAFTTHRDGHGTVIGALSDGSTPLFSVTATGTLAGALEGYLRDPSGAFAVPSAAALSFAEVGRGSYGDAVLVSFEQRYRGYPVDGAGSRIAVLLSGADVHAVMGLPIDQNAVATGLTGGLDARTAGTYVSRAWLAAYAGASSVTVSDLALVYVPSKGTMAWKASVTDDDGGGTVIVDAVYGGALLVHDDARYSLADGYDVRVETREHDDDPGTVAYQEFGGLPGSLWGSCDLQDVADGATCHVRMGDERLTVYDWYDDNSSVPHVDNTLTHSVWDGTPWALFTAGTSNESRLLFQRAVVATGYLDSLQPSWEHAPGQHLPTPPHLQVFANVEGATATEGPRCVKKDAGGNDHTAIGKFLGWQWDAEEPTLTDGYALLEAYDPAAPVPSVSICDDSEGTLYHEIGHYVDVFSAFGSMGSGVPSDGCVADTADEARPLGETLADMFALSMMRNTYPELAYDLSTTDLDNACSLNEAFTTFGTVHGDGCAGAASFDDTRPDQIEFGSCKAGMGYDQEPVLQAWWEVLHGMECDVVAPYTCTSVANHDPDPAVRAFLGAIAFGNEHSYRSFFQTIELLLVMNGEQAEADRLERIAMHHDIY